MVVMVVLVAGHLLMELRVLELLDKDLLVVLVLPRRQNMLVAVAVEAEVLDWLEVALKLVMVELDKFLLLMAHANFTQAVVVVVHLQVQLLMDWAVQAVVEMVAELQLHP
jgi:hypothetical protein